MHPLLQNSTFQLDYSPSSSESDCIGSQRAYSASAAFPTDDDHHHRRIGSLGQPLSQPAASTANGYRYNTQHSVLQDVHFAPSPGLLVSPLDSCSGVSSSSPVSVSSLSYTPGFPNDVTSTESIISHPASVYSHSVSSWNDRMPSDYRSPRIPALHPSASLSSSLQTPGTSISNSSSMVGRDNYPSAYTLSRGPYQSQGSDSRYSHYPTMPAVLGNPVEPSSTLYHHGSLLLDPLPRAGQPAADAPPFEDTEQLVTMMTSNQTIKPEIQAKIHKGFFQVDEKWTCYRRNYFSVSCSFSLRPWVPNTSIYVQCSHATERVTSFAMSISAVVNAQEGEVRELVQHTPKRDKQSERKPEKVALQPQQPFALASNIGTAGVTNHHGYGVPPHSSLEYTQSYSHPLQNSQPPTQHTFERIQFQKATANNGKRRAQQQYYNLVVELHAEIGNGSWVRVAKRLSHPMVVRGRSPGHYKDGRRDSSASMGPDSGGTGSSGDGSRGSMLPPSIGQGPYSHLAMMPYDHPRGSSHYGRGGPQHFQPYPRQLASTDQSPSSTSPLISSASSSPFEFIFNDSMDGVEENTSQAAPYHDVAFGIGSLSRKKSTSSGSRQSHLSGIDYGSRSDEQTEADQTFDDTYESMLPSYYGEPEDGTQYSKPSPNLPNMKHRQLAPMVPETGRSSRPTETSYSRFDSIQTSRSLCA